MTQSFFSTVSPKKASKFLNGVRKSMCRRWWGKYAVYKVKILVLPESTNKNFIRSHLPLLKYFLIKTLKSGKWSNFAVLVIQNCLSNGLGLDCGLLASHYIHEHLSASVNLLPFLDMATNTSPYLFSRSNLLFEFKNRLSSVSFPFRFSFAASALHGTANMSFLISSGGGQIVFLQAFWILLSSYVPVLSYNQCPVPDLWVV